MLTIRNPARSRPLSRNVKRLMKAARASPENPNVVKVARILTEKDLAYCDLQGNIFMAAVDRGIPMEQFAPMFMYSQLAAVIDFSFFHPGVEAEGGLPDYLQMPMLLKSPELIVDVLLWIEGIVEKLDDEESPRAALLREVNAPSNPSGQADYSVPNNYPEQRDYSTSETIAGEENNISSLTEKYAYAYWLGYIYRYESLLHEEASRMVFEVLDQPTMRETYDQMDFGDSDLSDCAPEICRRLDMMIVNKL